LKLQKKKKHVKPEETHLPSKTLEVTMGMMSQLSPNL
jgi:hypothetical protein